MELPFPSSPRNRHKYPARNPTYPFLSRCRQTPLPPSATASFLETFRRDCEQQNRNPTGLDNTENADQFDWEGNRRYMTHAGFRVRSKVEKIIADYLVASGLKFLYEPSMKIHGVICRPDFYLMDYNLAYEHFGLNTPEYLQAAESKIRRYHQAGIPFMYTTFNDEPDIEDIIVEKIAFATLEM